MSMRAGAAILLGLSCAAPAPADAPAYPADPPPLTIAPAGGAIAIDGDLSEPAWREASRIEAWYETNPGDNVPPAVKSVGYLTFDQHFFYAAFEFQDPEPRAIRAPYSDRDNVGSDTDYGGVILDTRNDGRTGVLLLANPRGVQYDAVSDDVTGNEDSSPDLFWESAAQVGGTGWVLEMRVPFSSLRYPNADPRTWGIMLYRNYPRAFRYQMFSTTLPRGGNCFICRSNKLTGLQGLPSARSVVIAPYANARRSAAPEGELGTPLRNQPFEQELGLDVKWVPNADQALDGTLNPDFSQIESDVAQIGANERFALFYPEKRPFFLEGVELLSTPIQAVYTRTITSPRWGLRGTGKAGGTAYTLLVAQDRGGGSVILPGANSSAFADQDFTSLVAVGRVRRDLGRSFVSFLGTAREIEGGGHNRVFGPDFQWRPTVADRITGEVLWSDTLTPRRPELAGERDARSLAGHALSLEWYRSTTHFDVYALGKDLGRGFRADNGFVPQVGYRRETAEAGYTFRPQGFVRRLRTFAGFDHSAEHRGGLLFRQFYAGAGLNARFNSFLRVWFEADRVRAGTATLPRNRVQAILEVSPSRFVSFIGLDGFLGGEVDFDNLRAGRGGNLNLRATVRPTDHLELRFNEARRWLDVDGPAGERARLFAARVDRVRATYNFTSRAFARLIAQYVETERDPRLYRDPVERRSADLGLSLLLAYKLNWQTVFFAGYGDGRALDENDELRKADRQLFFKISYAFQR